MLALVVGLVPIPMIIQNLRYLCMVINLVAGGGGDGREGVAEGSLVGGEGWNGG